MHSEDCCLVTILVAANTSHSKTTNIFSNLDKFILQLGQKYTLEQIQKGKLGAVMVAVNSMNPRAGSGLAQQPRIATARPGLTFRIQKSEFNRSLRILQQILPKTTNLEDDFPSWDKPACPATLESRQLGSTLYLASFLPQIQTTSGLLRIWQKER